MRVQMSEVINAAQLIYIIIYSGEKKNRGNMFQFCHSDFCSLLPFLIHENMGKANDLIALIIKDIPK